MKSYYHYYDVCFTKDATTFDREFTNDEYEVIPNLRDVDSSALSMIIEILQCVRPDVQRITILYNVYEHDDNVNEDVCLTCEVVLDTVRDANGYFVINE